MTTQQKVNIINLYNVADRKKWLNGDDNVFIGRGSKWGNPHLLSEHKNNREEVVCLYKDHLLHDKRLKNSTSELKGKVLGCWCAPSLCHGEVLHYFAGNIPVYEMNNSISEMSAAEMSSAQGLTTDQKLDLMLKRLDTLDNINETVSNIDRRLNQIELDNESIKRDLVLETQERIKLATTVSEVSVKANEVEAAVSFLSDKYEGIINAEAAQKEKVDKNSTDILMLKQENTILKSSIANLRNDLEQANITRNIEQQYHRTSLNIKLCGVPTQPGEEESLDGPSNCVTRDVIDLVCKTAGITVKRDAIDVCHRLGKLGKGPIIIRFATKCARFDFVKQGQSKLKGLTSDKIDFTKIKKRGLPPATVAVTRRRAENEESEQPEQQVAEDERSHPIYLQEHLTAFNKNLLRDTRAALDATHQYPGYVKNGEIRVKEKADSKYVVIKCDGDFQKELQRVKDNG